MTQQEAKVPGKLFIEALDAGAKAVFQPPQVHAPVWIEGEAYRLRDSPMHRFTYGVLDFLGEKKIKFYIAIIDRYRALGSVLPKLPQEWRTVEIDGSICIPYPVMYLAAELPIRGGKFSARLFLAELKKLKPPTEDQRAAALERLKTA
jgi:hypothetical protein